MRGAGLASGVGELVARKAGGACPGWSRASAAAETWLARWCPSQGESKLPARTALVAGELVSGCAGETVSVGAVATATSRWAGRAPSEPWRKGQLWAGGAGGARGGLPRKAASAGSRGWYAVGAVGAGRAGGTCSVEVEGVYGTGLALAGRVGELSLGAPESK